jgi:hypothetical protein
MLMGLLFIFTWASIVDIKNWIVKGFANVLFALYSAPYVNSGVQQCRLFLVVILLFGQN